MSQIRKGKRELILIVAKEADNHGYKQLNKINDDR